MFFCQISTDAKDINLLYSQFTASRRVKRIVFFPSGPHTMIFEGTSIYCTWRSLIRTFKQASFHTKSGLATPPGLSPRLTYSTYFSKKNSQTAFGTSMGAKHRDLCVAYSSPSTSPSNWWLTIPSAYKTILHLTVFVRLTCQCFLASSYLYSFTAELFHA